MADGKKKQALSLNQLHNRFLTDLSASQSKPKPAAVDFKCTEENDDVPLFSFDTPPPPLQGEENVEEPVAKFNDYSPQLFAGITDFDSPSSTLEVEEDNQSNTTFGTSSEITNSDTYPPSAAELHESGKIAEEDENTSEINPTISESYEHSTSFLGEERQMKVKIEGRRRLCKISKNDENAEGVGNNIKDEDPKFDGISDFDSPHQVNKVCESKGNEIRDILNDLSSRLETLSIEKRNVPKKTYFNEDFHEPRRSKLYDVHIEEGLPEYLAANSSSLFSSDYPANSIKGSKSGVPVTNEPQKKKSLNNEVEDDNFDSKASRTMYSNEVPSKNELRASLKSGFAKDSHAYKFQREEEASKTSNYVAMSEKHNPKKVDRRQGKFIEISDDESDGVTALGDHVDNFTLSGPKCTYRLPGKIAKMLFPHQREGLKWLWSLHCKGKGGILGDDMGLGKTMQICGFIAGLFKSNLIRRVLIVAPKTLLTHWINELSTVGLSGIVREYFATCTKLRHYELQYVLQDKGILLTTYDIVRNNTKSLCGDYRDRDDEVEDEKLWDYMVLDEGHLIKNPNTQRAKSLLQIPCHRRIIISGTPLQNNLKDLRDCIQPYFLRRLKSEVFSDNTLLSKKNEIIVWLRLTRCQRQLYEAFLKSEIVLSACDGSPLAALTILKKICDHPLLLTKRAAEDVLEGMDSNVNQEDRQVAEKLAKHIADVAERFDIVENHNVSCKLSFILSLLEDLIPKGHNVLIFSQTRKMLNLIQESLMSIGYKYMRIDGTTKASDRAQNVKDFQEGRGAPIFLLTSQVGGLGLTLTNADRVIVVDPAWNPSTDNQSVDRAYRIGQKKDVIVYRLMTCSTVEEKIYRKQVFKGGLFRSATEHKEQIRYFSQQDLRDLFSLPAQGFDISLTQQQLLKEHDDQQTMEESLRAHVEFLETLHIAGVSQHSLLFSKAAPVQTIDIEEEVGRSRGSKFIGNTSTHRSIDHNVDGAEFAFNPKDAKKFERNSPNDAMEPTEDEIRARLSRLSQMIANKALVSRLPDNGEKLERQIADLNLELDQLRITNLNNADVIDLEI
ncbi:hypothetical protein RD792_010739 [Penstemon davidsonii]|uniref:Protein CHROMATIN REMODELING 24 n=1 Tax=Penstemon davidsonii TaxID=160366 RepID=A0ABR0D2P4_9LAMI|nr:hypothetical protein RD792_010739 [Penstemon davidsonii]